MRRLLLHETRLLFPSDSLVAVNPKLLTYKKYIVYDTTAGLYYYSNFPIFIQTENKNVGYLCFSYDVTRSDNTSTSQLQGKFLGDRNTKDGRGVYYRSRGTFDLTKLISNVSVKEFV